MNEMGAMPIETPDKKQSKKNTFVNQVCRIRMSEWPEEAMKGKSKIVRDVSLYLEGNGKLWIHTNALEWLVKSLFIQQQLKGVADVGSDDEGPDAAESMEPDQTPEKCPRPQEAAGNSHARWDEAP